MKKQELKAILNTIEQQEYSNISSIDVLLEYGFKLAQWIAFSGEAMAEAKERLHKARKAAYLKVEFSLNAQGKKWSPMLAKDYVNDCCYEENGYYELCERTNRTATHTLDLVRTAISALKTELQTMTFNSQKP